MSFSPSHFFYKLFPVLDIVLVDKFVMYSHRLVCMGTPLSDENPIFHSRDVSLQDRLHLAMRCRRLLVCAERLAQKAPIDGRSLPCLTMSVDTENHPCFLATSQQQETGASGPVAKDEKRSDDSTCHLDSTAGDPDVCLSFCQS